MKIILTVDRIEDGLAVCLSDRDAVYSFTEEEIGFCVKEGDVLSLAFHLEEEETSKRKETVETLWQKLKDRS